MAIRHLHKYLIKYFAQLNVTSHEVPGILGFFLFAALYNQIFSGIALSFSLVPEPMYIPLSREEEDAENLYTDDFFWLHERGVDYVVVFLFLHMFRKLFVGSFTEEQELAWKSGSTLFLAMQFVIFFGLVLCCTHLSEITLLIAVNVFNTFCMFTGQLSWIIFPAEGLNVDTVVRLAYLHYILAIVVAYFAIYHGIDMHYDWKSDAGYTGRKEEFDWFDEVLVNELTYLLHVTWAFLLFAFYLYTEPDALNYEIFMWGDIGMMTDVRFLGVAPHWYFRPYMAWLIICPFHYIGIFGLIFFFLVFYFQPNITAGYTTIDPIRIKAILLDIYLWFVKKSQRTHKDQPTDLYTTEKPDWWDNFYQFTYGIALIAIYYMFSYLPFGRFFTRIGGNDASLFFYAYMYLYLGTTYLRFPMSQLLANSIKLKNEHDSQLYFSNSVNAHDWGISHTNHHLIISACY